MNDQNTLSRVEHACTGLVKTRRPVTFTAVAAATGLSRATLYRNPNLRAIINDHRAQASQASTLTGLTAELAHLRVALEAIATKARRHEERLRHLERNQKTDHHQ